jgi:hypothetical protein
VTVALGCGHDDHETVTSIQTVLPVVDLHDDPGELRARLRAVAHEVVRGPDEAFIDVDQLPGAFIINISDLGRRTSRIFAVYGRNAWKSRIRAHSDVAAAHRYV